MAANETWFAWYPVQVMDTDNTWHWIWLTRVIRRYYVGYHEGYYRYWRK